MRTLVFVLVIASVCFAQNIGGGINNPGSSGSGTTTGPSGTPTANSILTSTGTAQQVQDPGACTLTTSAFTCAHNAYQAVVGSVGSSTITTTTTSAFTVNGIANPAAIVDTNNGLYFPPTASNVEPTIFITNNNSSGRNAFTVDTNSNLTNASTRLFRVRTAGVSQLEVNGTGIVTLPVSTGVYGWGIGSGNSADTGISRVSAGVTGIGIGAQGDVSGTLQAGAYQTGTNCSSSASPALCGSSAAGSVAIPTGATPTLQVNTSAVTANSQIFVQVDETLGTKLSITCNTTLATLVQPIVTARSAGTSFTIQINSTLAANPACVSYFIVN